MLIFLILSPLMLQISRAVVTSEFTCHGINKTNLNLNLNLLLYASLSDVAVPVDWDVILI